MKPLHRALILAGFVFDFLLFYALITYYVMHKGVFHTPVWARVDLAIPFMPWTFFIYILVYIIPAFTCFLLPTKKSMWITVGAFFTTLWIVNLFWAFFPVRCDLRPMIDPHASYYLMSAIASFYKFDYPPINCFPSLHVTYALLCYFAIRAFRPKYSTIFGIIAVLITLSTMTFKQHYLADVVAGILLACLINFIFFENIFFSTSEDVKSKEDYSEL